MLEGDGAFLGASKGQNHQIPVHVSVLDTSWGSSDPVQTLLCLLGVTHSQKTPPLQLPASEPRYRLSF